MANQTAWKILVDAIVDAKDLDDLKAKVAGVTSELGKAEKQTSMTSKAIGFLTGAGASAAIGALGSIVKMAREEEVGIARLGVAVDNAGTSWAEHKGAIEAVVAARQRLSFSDDDLRGSLTVLTQLTGDVNKALRLQVLAMDVARAKSMSLADASELVGKVANGNLTPLTRMGAQLGKNATATEGLAYLQRVGANAAETYAATQQGAADRMKNAWDNALESVGGFVDEHLGVIASLATVYSGFGKGIHFVAGGLGTFIKQGGSVGGVLRSLSGAVRTFGIALKGLFLNPVGLAILAVGLLVLGLKYLYDHSKKVRDAVNVLGATLGRVFGPIIKVAGIALDWLGDRLGDIKDALGIVGDEADENLGEDLPRAAEEGARAVGTLRGAMEHLQGFMASQRGGAGQATEDLLKALGMDQATVERALDALDDTLGAGLAGRATKWFDRWYAENQPQARARIYDEAEAMAKIVEEGGQPLLDAATEAGLSIAKYIETANLKMKEADVRMKTWSDTIKEAQRQLGNLTAEELKSLDRKNAQIVAIHETRDAWNEARAAADGYNRTAWGGAGPVTQNVGGGGQDLNQRRGERAALDGMYVSATQRVLAHAGERILSPRETRAYDSGMGNVTIAPVFNYSGPATRAAAEQMAADVVDPLTEAVRQQLRRMVPA